MSTDSEKITDCQLLVKFNEVFDCFYNTNGNNKLFGSKIPDGWFKFDNKLLIIENKKNLKDKRKGLEQLLNYYLTASKTKEFKKYKQCFLILGCGTTKDFKYWIYSMDNNNIKETKYKLKDLKTKDYKPSFDLKEIHEFNQYLYNCGINLPKNQKTLFVAAILLCLKINPKFLISYDDSDKGFIIADKIIDTIKDYYQDLTFAKSFEFIKYNLHNKELFDLINIVSIDIKKYGIDILKQFYNEFMIYDKNNDSACGIVLTPHDIVELMVKSLNIKKGESVADFCTGTGSFLVEASKYTDHLVGCENGEERYALAKCNFILKDLSIEHLYFNNCFNQQFEFYDHIILNPPFSCNSSDNGEIKDLYGWRKLKNEQKFVIYQLQYLKDGGIGCCIIPRSNFNNSTNKSLDFKKLLLKYCDIIKIVNCNSKVFAPVANVECTVCVFKKCKSSNFETEIIDYSDDGYIIKDKARIKQKEANIKSYKTVLKFDDEWNYNKPSDKLPNIEQLMILNKLKQYKNEIDEQIKLLEKQLEESEENNKDYDWFLLDDLIEPLKIKTYTYDKCESGSIPFYVASKFMSPKGFKNVVSVDCEQLGLNEVLTINKSGEGVIGYCYKRSGKFGCNGLVGVYKMKRYLSDFDIFMIQQQLIPILNHHFLHFGIQHLKTIKIYLPKEDIKTDGFEYFDEKIKSTFEDLGNIKIKEWKQIKIGDYFELLPPGKIDGNKRNTEEGIYNLVSTGQQNNGIIKNVNVYEYDGEANQYLTVAMYGTTGSTFYQKNKFIVNHNVRVLKPKHKMKEEEINLFALMINYYLTKKYSYSNGLSISKLKNEIINYPIIYQKFKI